MAARAGRWTMFLLGVAVVVVGVRGREIAHAELPPAYDPPALPAALDSVTPLADAVAQIEACRAACSGLVYVWSARMPLSRAGIPNVASAAGSVDARLTLVAFEELADYAASGPTEGAAPSPVADAMLAAGALAHAPALVVHLNGEIVGSAVLGYKTAAAYEAAIARRLAGAAAADSDPGASMPGDGGAWAPSPAVRLDGALPTPRLVDYPVLGLPGAYFRWVAGRDAVAYEAGQRVYMLDLADGQSRVAPGYIDFVPTPDGRYFVTPGEVDGGLTFYDAEEVFEAVRSGRPGDVEPIFSDLRMRDQYPSVGILAQDSSHTLYRVMTSWFEGVVYRDYDVRVDARSGASSVRPVGEPVRPCAGVALSTPIMSQSGLEVAGRDEATGTTKIFGILEGGRCDAVTDLGVPTSKVAWHRTGRRLAFSIPRRSRTGGASESGIFVLDRDTRDLTRLAGSEEASRLAFPDFVGDDSVIFLLPRGGSREGSVFRVVDHVR